VLHQLEQEPERRLVEPLRRVDPSHVIDDEGHAQAVEKRSIGHEVLGVQVEHGVPAERRGAVQQRFDGLEVGRAAEVPDEIEAQPAHAAVVQRAQFPVGDVRVDHRDAAPGAVRRCDRVEHRAVVSGVAAACARTARSGAPVQRRQRLRRVRRRVRRAAAYGRAPPARTWVGVARAGQPRRPA
jgi:hypothetical protein